MREDPAGEALQDLSTSKAGIIVDAKRKEMVFAIALEYRWIPVDVGLAVHVASSRFRDFERRARSYKLSVTEREREKKRWPITGKPFAWLWPFPFSDNFWTISSSKSIDHASQFSEVPPEPAKPPPFLPILTTYVFKSPQRMAQASFIVSRSAALKCKHYVALNEALTKEFLARTGGVFRYGRTITTPRNSLRDLTFEEDNNGSKDDDRRDAPQPFPSASAPPPLTVQPPQARCSAPSPPLPLAPSVSPLPSTSLIPVTRSTFPARECPDPWDWFPVLAIGAVVRAVSAFVHHAALRMLAHYFRLVIVRQLIYETPIVFVPVLE
ncbi:hypothetical protein C8J56DRAFT_888945 [Mycena floridula]|nr:hypothetical protein C8J56DRAFT_888945 [Mycena floridula]